jgi:hypothetical protein
VTTLRIIKLTADVARIGKRNIIKYFARDAQRKKRLGSNLNEIIKTVVNETVLVTGLDHLAGAFEIVRNISDS